MLNSEALSVQTVSRQDIEVVAFCTPSKAGRWTCSLHHGSNNDLGGRMAGGSRLSRVEPADIDPCYHGQKSIASKLIGETFT
jgi:hypothetical protein